MSYAVIKTGGKQYSVIEGQTLLIERLPDDVGATVELQPLLLAGDGDPVFEGDGLAVRARQGGDRRAPARAEAARVQVQAQAWVQASHRPPSGADAHQDHVDQGLGRATHGT